MIDGLCYDGETSLSNRNQVIHLQGTKAPLGFGLGNKSIHLQGTKASVGFGPGNQFLHLQGTKAPIMFDYVWWTM